MFYISLGKLKEGKIFFLENLKKLRRLILSFFMGIREIVFSFFHSCVILNAPRLFKWNPFFKVLCLIFFFYRRSATSENYRLTGEQLSFSFPLCFFLSFSLLLGPFIFADQLPSNGLTMSPRGYTFHLSCHATKKQSFFLTRALWLDFDHKNIISKNYRIFIIEKPN